MPPARVARRDRSSARLRFPPFLRGESVNSVPSVGQRQFIAQQRTDWKVPAPEADDAHTAGEIDVIRKSSIRIGGTSAVPGLS